MHSPSHQLICAVLPLNRLDRFPKRCKVAAALSAAVTTTQSIGDASSLQAEPTMQKHPLKRQPLSGREREGGAFLRKAASLASSSYKCSYTKTELGGVVEDHRGPVEGTWDGGDNTATDHRVAGHEYHGAQRRAYVGGGEA